MEDQYSKIQRSKELLEETFQKEVKGLVAPKGKHDFTTLTSAKRNSLKYFASGSLSYIRY